MSSATLPAGAQPWSAWLEWFAAPLAGTVNELVRGLQPLLTPMRGRPQPGDAEPDGLDDLRRRGLYERLLPTEWLLAEELPEEFLRRAAAGEHLFFANRPRAERQRRRLVALFDAGPTQLGAPRLVHLALWILLARRARLAGVELAWGLLQEPGTVYPAQGAADLKLLLAGRAWHAPGAVQQEGWGKWLAENRAGLAECWRVVSPASLEAMAALPCTHTLSVANSLEEEALDVALRDRGGRRTVQLRLPRPALGAALLRGHFDSDAQPGVQLDAGPGLSGRYAPVFSPDGRRVAVALKEHGVAIYSLRSKAAEAQRGPLREQWAKRRQALGIAITGRRVAALLREDDSLLFWRAQREYAAPYPPVSQFSVPPGTLAWRSCYVTAPSHEEHFFALDAQRRLVFWAADPNRRSDQPARGPHLVRPDVYAVVQNGARALHFVHRVGNELQLSESLGTLGVRRLIPGGATIKAPQTALFLARPPNTSATAAPVYLVAVREEFDPAEIWNVHLYEGVATQQARVALEPGERAVGLVFRREPALVVLAPNRRQFHLVSQGGREAIYAAPRPVTRSSVCPVSGQMALLGADGALVVYDLHSLSLRLSVAPGSGDPQ